MKLILRLLLTVMGIGVTAAAAATVTDTTFVYLRGGGVDIFPAELAQVSTADDGTVSVSLADGSTTNYPAADVLRVSHDAPDNLPTLTSFKLNNKYNDQVYDDVFADINADGTVKLTVGAIGKWLTPSFQLSDPEAQAYIGDELQQSKVSRRRFDKEVVYTVALPDMHILRRRQLTEEVWSTTDDTLLPVTLTTDMLWTNAPSNYDEGLDKMIDGDPTTFFHSTWGQGTYTKLPEDSCPCIDIHLNTPLQRLQWTMLTRADRDRNPTALELLASADGTTWHTVATYTTDSGLPTQPGDAFTSPTADLGSPCSFLRLKLLAASYKNYFCVAELSLAEVIPATDEPQLITPATYEYRMEPYGRDYRVTVDWATDKATGVPIVRIDTDNGAMVNSKTVYLDADISIDGAGVFPSMTGRVHIKGRGNTSWSNNAWDKNPYRLKFDEKVKPFGLTNGKNWVLLANKMSGSMMTNAVGMKAACLARTASANHIVPVELYINGDYRGCYDFTEKVGIHNNSIDLADESRAVLLELDTYYDETYKFRSSPYNLPVNIKKPDFNEDATQLTSGDISRDFNNFMASLSDGKEIADLVDIDALARFLMVNDLISNFEIFHPKSTFLYKENVGNSKYVFGPVWDLDWAFGYEQARNYCTQGQQTDFYTGVWMEARQFINDLRYVSPQLDRCYYKVWTLFMQQGLDELLDFCTDYYDFVRPAFNRNQTKWGDGNGYANMSKRMRNWLEARAHYVYNHLTAYDLTDEELDTGIDIVDNKQGFGSRVDVYNLQGICVKRNVSVGELRSGLPAGIYIVNGRKMLIR